MADDREVCAGKTPLAREPDSRFQPHVSAVIHRLSIVTLRDGGRPEPDREQRITRRTADDGLHNENARLQIYHCTGVSEQKYILVQANTGSSVIPGYFEIRPQSDPRKCPIPSSRSAFNGQPVTNGQGAQVVQQTCAFFAQDQNWTFKSTNEIVNQFWGCAWTPRAAAPTITSTS